MTPGVFKPLDMSHLAASSSLFQTQPDTILQTLDYAKGSLSSLYWI